MTTSTVQTEIKLESLSQPAFLKATKSLRENRTYRQKSLVAT
jgi:hypothetical protein